jgi:ABC-type antimicrobial peptide transport system permease subunit
MFFVPLAQEVPYKDDLMRRIEVGSHFVEGAMLVTNATPGMLEPLLTRAFAEVDPNLTINGVKTMQQQVEQSFDQERSIATLAGLFGIVALLLAAVGLYGVTAYTVAQRTNEIGIRMALGAQTRDVLRLMMAQGMWLILIGIAIGLVAAYAGARLMASILFGVGTNDLLTFVGVPLFLIVIALIACYVPSRRATKVDPLVALRGE